MIAVAVALAVGCGCECCGVIAAIRLWLRGER